MNRLKQLREEKNLLQSDIGKLLGVTSNAVGYYENGKRDIPTEYIIKLADFFGVTTDYILGKSNLRNPEEIKIDTDKINIGLSVKDYTHITDNQRKQIEEFAKFVLKDNLKNKDSK